MTYGQLPSYVIANATTFDIEVTEALAEYEQERISGRKPTPQLSQEEMLRMIESVKNRSNDKKTTSQS